MQTDPSPAIPARTQRLLLMAQTMTLEEMARQESISRERVRQLLAAVGFSRRSVTRPCVNCGGRTRHTYCDLPACRKAYNRARYLVKRPRSGDARAVCAHCGAILRRPVRLDGKPSFCYDKQPCLAARQNWRYHHEPHHRAYVERYRKSERGREVSRRAGARYRASKRGTEQRARRYERARQQDALARATRQRAREARAAARAECAAARAAAHAVALARVQEAIRLRGQQLSERAIAAQVGVSRTIVHYWLHGQRRARALSTPPAESLFPAA